LCSNSGISSVGSGWRKNSQDDQEETQNYGQGVEKDQGFDEGASRKEAWQELDTLSPASERESEAESDKTLLTAEEIEEGQMIRAEKEKEKEKEKDTAAKASPTWTPTNPREPGTRGPSILPGPSTVAVYQVGSMKRGFPEEFPVDGALEPEPKKIKTEYAPLQIKIEPEGWKSCEPTPVFGPTGRFWKRGQWYYQGVAPPSTSALMEIMKCSRNMMCTKGASFVAPEPPLGENS
jgi:hypothetical protein